jgi:hypothetical protein
MHCLHEVHKMNAVRECVHIFVCLHLFHLQSFKQILTESGVVGSILKSNG